MALHLSRPLTLGSNTATLIDSSLYKNTLFMRGGPITNLADCRAFQDLIDKARELLTPNPAAIIKAYLDANHALYLWESYHTNLTSAILHHGAWAIKTTTPSYNASLTFCYYDSINHKIQHQHSIDTIESRLTDPTLSMTHVN